MPYPVIPDVPVGGGSVSTTMQNAAAANGNGTVLNLLATASIIYTVTMAAFSGTVNFEVTEDGVNWDPLQVTQEGTNTIFTSITGVTTTFVHLYEGSVAGLLHARARVSGFSAGTVTVTAHAVASTDAPRVTNVNLVNSGTPAIVQKANNVSTGSVTTLAKAFASNNLVGNTIIVVAGSGSNAAMTVADTQGNTYTSAVTGVQSTTVGVAIFYAVNIAGGANTVTLTCTSSSAAMEIYEVSGLLAQVAGQPVQSSSGSSASGTTATTSNIAGAGNSYAFMGVGIGTAAQNITVTTGTNWTADAGTNGLVPGATVSGLFQFQSLSQFLPGVKPVLPTATIASAENWAAVAAVFKPVTVNVEGTVTIGGYNYTNMTSQTTTLIKTGAGLLHAVVVNKPVAAGTIELDDALTHTNPFGTITIPATATNPFSLVYDVQFSTGLSITTAGATQDITLVWR